MLATQAADGPVPTTILGEMAGLEGPARDRLIADALAEGVRGLDVVFAPGAEATGDQPRLVVVLNRAGPYTPAVLCRQPGTVATTAPEVGRLELAAAYCQGTEPLNAVEARAGAAGERATSRLLWRTAAELFPDDYARTYGFGLLPGWLDLGIGGTFGF